jgi:HSP20 family molecular chaperone IbpA
MKHYLQTGNNNYNYSVFDAWNDFFRPAFYDEGNELRTNIKETKDNYVLDIEIPGYKKEDIKVALDDGYLTISAKKQKVENAEGESYLRKEISSSCQRSYYVGTDLTCDDIKAKYEDGILNLTVPKSQPKQIQNHFINID